MGSGSGGIVSADLAYTGWSVYGQHFGSNNDQEMDVVVLAFSFHIIFRQGEPKCFKCIFGF